MKVTYVWEHVAGQLNVGVVSIQSDIFGEVGNLVLTIGEVRGVVDVDVVVTVFLTLALVVLKTVFVDEILNLLDDSGVEEVLGEDFVRRWKDDTIHILTLKDSIGVSLQKAKKCHFDNYGH